jgi:hypothetical protein
MRPKIDLFDTVLRIRIRDLRSGIQCFFTPWIRYVRKSLYKCCLKSWFKAAQIGAVNSTITGKTDIDGIKCKY